PRPGWRRLLAVRGGIFVRPRARAPSLVYARPLQLPGSPFLGGHGRASQWATDGTFGPLTTSGFVPIPVPPAARGGAARGGGGPSPGDDVTGRSGTAFAILPPISAWVRSPGPPFPRRQNPSGLPRLPRGGGDVVLLPSEETMWVPVERWCRRA